MTARLAKYAQRLWSVLWVFGQTSALHAADDQAKHFPTAPIHIVVTFSAGGGNDILARIIGQKLQERLGQSVVIDNKPGANGFIGVQAVARAPADGYTLLLGATGPMVVNPAVYDKLMYDTQRDFIAVSEIADFPLILIVNSVSDIKSISDLIAFAKANPAKANYASSSTAFQLASELFNQKAGVSITGIPYKGSGDSVLSVVSGGILMTIADTLPIAAQIRGGRVRALAVTSTQRLREFPDIPTMAEAGLPGVEVNLWSGIFLPAGTPLTVVAKLQDAFMAICRDTDTIERLRALGVEPVGNSSAEFSRTVASDLARWSAIAKASNIRIQQ